MQTVLRLKYIMMDPTADNLLTASIGRSPRNDPDPPGPHHMLTTMAYLSTMLRSLLRRKQGHDIAPQTAAACTAYAVLLLGPYLLCYSYLLSTQRTPLRLRYMYI